jgi:class 3 adenylate cyclase
VDDSALETRIALLERHLNDHGAARRWHEFIVKASDDELHRMNAFSVAQSWQIEGRAALTEFLHATRAGLVSLNWDAVCNACGFANMHERLDTVRALETCRACGGQFDVAFDKTIEVTFTVHPAIREITPSKAQANEAPSRPVTGLDCATLPAFREFFATEVLSFNESLQVVDVTIMFTDIKGSTELYNRLGDARAYRAVRRHFDLLFETVAANRGAIVKTIGDAVMASFTRPSDALCAAIAAQESFNGFRPLLPDATDEIIIKIGIHHGPCIAVTLNNALDFFGSAINIAARTQQFARGGETLITEAMREDTQAEGLLESMAGTIAPVQASLRGFSEKFTLYRIGA